MFQSFYIWKQGRWVVKVQILGTGCPKCKLLKAIDGEVKSVGKVLRKEQIKNIIEGEK